MRFERLGASGKGGARIRHELFQSAAKRFGVEVELLLRVAHPLHQLTRERALGEETEPGQTLLKKIAQTFLKAILQIVHPARKLSGVGHNQFGRRARRRRAEIGDEICDREINFVADGADDRNGRVKNGARHDFFVELPQVFNASPAARDHNQVDGFPPLVRSRQFLDRSGNLRGRADSLHAHRIDEYLHIWRPPPQDIEHVADRRAARRSDDADPFREFRQGAFPGRIEQTFRFQFPLERFELGLEQTRAARL